MGGKKLLSRQVSGSLQPYLEEDIQSISSSWWIFVNICPLRIWYLRLSPYSNLLKCFISCVCLVFSVPEHEEYRRAKKSNFLDAQQNSFSSWHFLHPFFIESLKKDCPRLRDPASWPSAASSRNLGKTFLIFCIRSASSVSLLTFYDRLLLLLHSGCECGSGPCL